MGGRWVSLATVATVSVLGMAAAMADYSFDNPDEYLADAVDWRPWHDVLRRNAIDSDLLSDCVAALERCPKRYRGVATLIIVMSVMNGFRAELLGRILGVNGHFVVRGYDGNLQRHDEVHAQVKSLAGVIASVSQPLGV